MANSTINFSSFISTVVPQVFFEQIRISKFSNKDLNLLETKDKNLIVKEINFFNKTRLVENDLLNEQDLNFNNLNNGFKTINLTNFLLLESEFLRSITDHNSFSIVYLHVKNNPDLVSLLASGEASLNQINDFIKNGSVIFQRKDLKNILTNNIGGIYPNVITDDGRKDFYKFYSHSSVPVESRINNLASFVMLSLGSNKGNFLDEKREKFGPINGEQIIVNSFINNNTSAFYTKDGKLWAGPVHQFLSADGTVKFMTGLVHLPDGSSPNQSQETLIEVANSENSKIIDDLFLEETLLNHLLDFKSALSEKQKNIILSENLETSENFTIQKKFSANSKVFSSITENKTTNNLFFINAKNILLANSKFSNMVERLDEPTIMEVYNSFKLEKILINRFGKEEISNEDTLIMEFNFNDNIKTQASFDYKTKYYSILAPDTIFSTFNYLPEIKTGGEPWIKSYNFTDYFPLGPVKERFFYSIEMQFNDPLRDLLIRNFDFFKNSLDSVVKKINLIESLQGFDQSGKLDNKKTKEIMQSLVKIKPNLNKASETTLENYLNSKFLKLFASYLNLVNLLSENGNKKIKKTIISLTSSLNLNFCNLNHINKTILFFNKVEKLISERLQNDKMEQSNHDNSNSIKIKSNNKQNRNKIYLNFTSDLIEMPKETQNLISYLEDPLEVSTASGPISSPKALQGGPRIINTKFINATQSAKLKSGLLMPIRIASK